MHFALVCYNEADRWNIQILDCCALLVSSTLDLVQPQSGVCVCEARFANMEVELQTLEVATACALRLFAVLSKYQQTSFGYRLTLRPPSLATNRTLTLRY